MHITSQNICILLFFHIYKKYTQYGNEGIYSLFTLWIYSTEYYFYASLLTYKKLVDIIIIIKYVTRQVLDI